MRRLGSASLPQTRATAPEHSTLEQCRVGALTPSHPWGKAGAQAVRAGPARAHLWPWGRPAFLQEKLCLGTHPWPPLLRAPLSLDQLRQAAALALGCPLHRPRALLGEDLSDCQPLCFPLVQNQKPQRMGSKGIPEGIMPTRNNLCSLPFVL